jgi:hypothetical protein
MIIFHKKEEDATKVDVAKVGVLGAVSLILFGVIFGHISKWAVDSWYYAITQTTKQVKDLWDRLPVHLDNLTQHKISLLHHFINTGQAAPEWWYTDRHAARGLIIGTFAGLIVLAILAKPNKVRRHYGAVRMAATPFLVIATALPIWIGFGLLFNKLPVLYDHGYIYNGSNPLLLDVVQLFGKTTFQVTVVGIIASFVVNKLKIASGPADEAQWYYAEHGWKIGPPNFHCRIKYLERHPEIQRGTSSKWMTRVMAWGMAFILISAGAGFWIMTYGPGAHAA